MADKAEKKPEAATEKTESARSASGGVGGMLTRTPVLLGGVILIEAAVLFAGFKFLGSGPAPVVGAELAPDPQSTSATRDEKPTSTTGSGAGPVADKTKVIEIQVLEFRAPNKLSGRTFLYDVSIYLVTRAENEKIVKETIDSRKALITDRIRTIIAQCDPEKLGGGSEPGLETLRRQVKYQLDEIIGDGMIEEVLVPRCIPFRTDY